MNGTHKYILYGELNNMINVVITIFKKAFMCAFALHSVLQFLILNGARALHFIFHAFMYITPEEAPSVY